MILGLPDREVLRSVINLRANGNFSLIREWLQKELEESGQKLSVLDNTFCLTKAAGAVMLLAELIHILSDAEELIGLQPNKQEEEQDEG